MQYETAFWALIILGYLNGLHMKPIMAMLMYVFAATIYFFPEYI
jgi:hypothetical protein